MLPDNVTGLVILASVGCRCREPRSREHARHQPFPWTSVDLSLEPVFRVTEKRREEKRREEKSGNVPKRGGYGMRFLNRQIFGVNQKESDVYRNILKPLTMSHGPHSNR
uniref:Unclassified n=1 Tax=Fusarium clavum TaxID=2594811 RepID=W1IBB8_9HYPO|nr:unclassified [Fusarium clavum]CEF82623.1 unclassified [Fusarium clavum]